MSQRDVPYSAVAVPNGGWDPRVRVFRCGRMVDSFAVVTERFVVLVDTMCNPESATAIVETLRPEFVPHESGGRIRPLLVVNTHGDWDHVWGNGVFIGPDARYPAPVIAHRLAAERMTSDEAVAFLTSFKRENPGRVDSVTISPPTLLFDGNLRIDGGDLTLNLVPTPGHTPDHVSVWIPEIGTLLAGDAAEQPVPFVPDPSGLPALRDSLRRLAGMNAATVLYCHAQGVTDASVITANIAYFDELEGRCRAVLADGHVTETPEAGADLGCIFRWTAEEAFGRDPDPEINDFYRLHHNSAIRSMLTWLRG